MNTEQKLQSKIARYQLIGIFAGVLIVILFCLGYRWHTKVVDGMDEEIKKFALTNQSFRIKINADSTIKITQEQLISSERNAKILAQSAADGLRNITSVTKTKIVIVHDTITAPYTGDIDPLDTCINVGTKFYEASKYDTIQGEILSTGVQIIRSPYYLGDITTVIGQEKYGILKLKSKPVVQVSFTNPNVRVTSMSNVVVKQPKPKRLGWLISGIAIGITGGILLMAN